MPDLNLSDIRKISGICNREEWQNLNGSTYHPKYDNFVEIISEFVKSIGVENRPLVYELLKHYEIIPDYTRIARRLSEEFKKKIKNEINYYITPTLPPEGGQIKSGHHFCYEVKSKFPLREYKNVKFLSDPFSKDIIDISDDSAIVFVDDFIGTGTQFKKGYEKFAEIHGSPRNIMLIVIRIQEEAYNYLQTEFNVKIISDGICKKAISSGRAIGSMTVEEAYDSYRKIEKLIKISNNYSLGYKEAEAIITMKRTPNDTLPIFWAENDKENNKWPAPFPIN